MKHDHYLGDGLYAQFDGWQIILRAPRAEGDHWVALEPEVMFALGRYLVQLHETTEGGAPSFLALRRALDGSWNHQPPT